MKTIYNNGQVKEFDLEDNEESNIKIKEALFKRSDREKGSDIRSVELQLPSEILNVRYFLFNLNMICFAALMEVIGKY